MNCFGAFDVSEREGWRSHAWWRKMRKKAKKDGRKRTGISLKFARISAVFRMGSHISSLLLYFCEKTIDIFWLMCYNASEVRKFI